MSEERQIWCKIVGEALRRRRLALGQTLEDVGIAVGASAASVSSWERGEVTLSAFWHSKLIAYFEAEFAKLPKSKRSAKVSA